MLDPTPTPSDPQAATREAARAIEAETGFDGAYCKTLADIALTAAGLVITAPDAPSRASGEVVIPSDLLTLNDLKQIKWYLWMSYEKGSGEMSSKVGRVIAALAAAGDAPE